jgi:MFS family permease
MTRAAELKEFTPGQWALIVLIYLLGVLQSASFGMMSPMVGKLAIAVGTSTQSVGTAFAAMFLPFLLAATFVGYAADRFGTRNVLLAGTGMYCIAALANLKVNNILWLVVDNFIMGLGMITVIVAGQTAYAKQTTGKAQAAILSLWATSMYGGTAAGLWLSGTFIETDFWRAPFAIQVALALCLAIGFAFLQRSDTSHIPIERPNKEKRDLRRLLKETKALRLCMMYGLTTLSTVAAVSVWPLYLSKVHDIPIGTVAKMTAVAHPTALLGSAIAGYLLTRGFAARNVHIMYTVGALAGAFVVLSSITSIPVVSAALFIWSISGGAWMAFNNAMVPRMTDDPDNIGATTGLQHQCGGIGAVIGPPLFSAAMAQAHTQFILIAIIAVCWLVPTFVIPIWRTRDTSGLQDRYAHKSA